MSDTSSRLADVVAECRAAGNFDRLVSAIPYAQFLGMRCSVEEDGDLLFCLPAKAENIGNPTLPALHGGAIGGFMEHAALIHLLATMNQPRMPKTIDLSIDYLRAGHYRDCWASCTVTRQGRRVANVMITCWQEDRSLPITQARAHFLLADPDAQRAAEGAG
ncbi:MAG: PaaI family thioesterase [Pseudomonadota bacterium]